jgi:hypothetical protein
MYYVFTKPLAVPKGARLEMMSHFDNSVNTKLNPDPTVEVPQGEQATEEMQ